MEGVRRRLERLEGTRTGSAAELTREALRHLSDDDLDALEDALEAGQEDGSATFEDLYCVVIEQGRRALENLFECIEAIREGREPRIPPEGETGEEGTRQDCNGYRIWKYSRK